MKKIKIKKFSIYLLVLAVLCCIGFITPFQDFLVKVYEHVKGAPVVNPQSCRNRIIKITILFIAFIMLSAVLIQFLNFSKDSKGKTILLFSPVHKDKKLLISVLCIFGICFSVRLFYIFQRQSFHVDEPLTINISNFNTPSFWIHGNFSRNELISVKKFKQMSLFDDGSFKDAISDINLMHVDVCDLPHTNFYYTLFRLWFACKVTYDNLFIIRYGCCLNLIFFAISFYFLLQILLIYTKDHRKIVPILFISFFNPWSISVTLFLRPYEMQQTSLILFSFLFLSVLERLKNNENFESKKNLLITSLCISFILGTEYFSIFFVFLLGLYLIIKLCLIKDYNKLLFFITSFISGLIITKILYKNWGTGLLIDRGAEALGKLSSQYFLSNLLSSMKKFPIVLTKFNIFIIVFGFICLVYFIFLFIKDIKNYSIHFEILCYIWILIVFFFSPYKMQRYFRPIIPLCFIYLISEFKFRKYIMPALCSLIFVSCLPIKYNLQKKVIDYLNPSQAEKFASIDNYDNIAIFYQDSGKWKLTTIIPNLKDDANCILFNFDEVIPDLENYVYIVEKDFSFDFENDEHYQLIENLEYFSFYKKVVSK